MKMKSITIKVQSLAESMAAFGRAVQAIQRGHRPSKATDELAFESLDAMRKVLTPKRLELLQVIRRDRPASIYALAKATGRNLSNVQDDVAILAKLGLVAMSRGRHARSGMSPRVEYDQIRLDIPLNPASAPEARP